LLVIRAQRQTLGRFDKAPRALGKFLKIHIATPFALVSA
jgi:hypothetical protein